MSAAKHSTASSGRAPAVARAVWNGAVLAETTRPVLLEGNVYFPPEDGRHEHLAATRHRSVCAWKGLEGPGPVLHRPRRRAAEHECRLVLPAPQPARPQDQKPCGVLARGAGGHRPGVTAAGCTATTGPGGAGCWLPGRNNPRHAGLNPARLMHSRRLSCH